MKTPVTIHIVDLTKIKKKALKNYFSLVKQFFKRNSITIKDDGRINDSCDYYLLQQTTAATIINIYSIVYPISRGIMSVKQMTNVHFQSDSIIYSFSHLVCSQLGSFKLYYIEQSKVVRSFKINGFDRSRSFLIHRCSLC